MIPQIDKAITTYGDNYVPNYNWIIGTKGPSAPEIGASTILPVKAFKDGLFSIMHRTLYATAKAPAS
jgi:hypothetical protein